MNKGLRIAILIISFLGVCIMLYLVKVGYSTGESSFCDLGEKLSCDLVNKSKYAKIFGVPLSGMGVLYFLWMFFTTLRRYTPDMVKMNTLLTVVFLGPSLYLTSIEIFVLKSYCLFCETSKVLMFILVGLGIWALRPVKIEAKAFGGAIIAAMLLAGTAYLAHQSSDPGDKYNEFAQCLNEQGFTMLGSATCASCLKQRDMFGEAFHFVREVECDPRNADTPEEKEQVEFCKQFNIRKTPTWVKLDAADQTLYRFEAGIQEFETLSKESGCALPAEN